MNDVNCLLVGPRAQHVPTLPILEMISIYGRKDVEAVLGTYVDGSPLDRIVRELEPMGSQVFDIVTSQVTVVGLRGEVNLASALLAQTVRRFKRAMKSNGLQFGHDVMLVRFGNDPVPHGYKLYESEGSYISFVGTSIRLKFSEYIKSEHYDEIWHRDTYLGNFDH